MAPRVAPLQWTPSQYTTNSVSAGYAAIFDSMILRYGILIAPGTWPAVYLSGPRTSTTTMPGSPVLIASWTSAGSTSKASSLWKCSRATVEGAAGTVLTRLLAMTPSSRGGSTASARWLHGAIGENAKIRKHTDIRPSAVL